MVPILIALWALSTFSYLQLALACAALAVWFKFVDADLSTWFRVVWYKLRECNRTARPLQGTTAWVTGASSGIGEACCYELARLGACLILSARRKGELLRVQAACTNPASHHVLPLDLGDVESHPAKVRAALELAGGNIDLLLNNAGRSQRGLVEDTVLDVDRQQLHLNTLGTMSLTKALLSHWLARGSDDCPAGRHVVVVSSLAGKLGSPGGAAYSASKHALHGFFDSLRIETCGQGVHTTIVCPGPVVSSGSANAITATGGTARNDPSCPESSYHKRRMDTARCAVLIGVAIRDRLKEVWISPQPELLYTYLAQYAPIFFGYLSTLIGPGRVKQYRSRVRQESTNNCNKKST